MEQLDKIKDEIKGFIAILTGSAIFLSLLTYNSEDPTLFKTHDGAKTFNLLGPAGAFLSDLMFQAIGVCAFLIPIFLLVYGVKRLSLREKRASWRTALGLFLLFVSLTSLFALFLSGLFDFPTGGLTGKLITDLTLQFFSLAGSLFIFLPMLLFTIMLFYPFSIVDAAKKGVVATGSGILSLTRHVPRFDLGRVKNLFNFDPEDEIEEEFDQDDEPDVIGKKPSKPIASERPLASARLLTSERPLESERSSQTEQSPELPVAKEPRTDKKKPQREISITRGPENPYLLPDPDEEPKKSWYAVSGDFELPSLDYLMDPPEEKVTPSREELISKSAVLEKKLKDFEINGNVTQVYPGPVVALFEFEPAPGVKINKIVSLSDDLALSLKAMSVRVSPVPGKAALGIEVPNKSKEVVMLKEILASSAFTKNPSKLTLALGKDIFGNPVVTDLAKMPHLLVAGATGSGKSVAMNSMVLSLLYRASPREVRMLMVDPKLLELSIYNDIPHLLLPVITTPKDATESLKKMVQEMEHRYKLLAEKGSRNIDSYNSKIESEEEFMPYIVILIDELADLMLVSKKEVEEPIARLAQMARAAGIHMILATQRPSVDVITGVIKANFPSRISFQVSSKVDSRTILDTMGAEKLLGKGDMLFITPGTKMMRVHGAYVTEHEINKIVDKLKEQQRPDYAAFQNVNYNEPPKEDEVEVKEGRDEIYRKSVEIVVATGQASISYIQRRLKIGYNKAARVMEMMEEDGVVGPPVEAGKPREVLIKK
jgi:S-DNA-T family DNA segregation ATPase FtsK/SpoIIIE